MVQAKGDVNHPEVAPEIEEDPAILLKLSVKTPTLPSWIYSARILLTELWLVSPPRSGSNYWYERYDVLHCLYV